MSKKHAWYWPQLLFRNHLLKNGLLPRIYGNGKKIAQWKTKMIIDTNVAAAVKNFLVNYAEVHGLPMPVRNVIRR
jgi:hypothetical protein